MKPISTQIKENEFMVYVPDGTCVTVLINDYSVKSKVNYIHVLFRYGPWSDSRNIDIFQYLRKPDIKELRLGKIYLLFDITTEGFSPLSQIPLFSILYNNCNKYHISPRQIIYASSNLLDQENMLRYVKKNNVIPFNILSFPAFQHIFLPPKEPIDDILDQSRQLTKKYFFGKYFSSLSRNLRGHRAIAHFLLFNSPIFEKSLTSHDRVNGILPMLAGDLQKIGTDKQIKRWIKSLPMTIDQTDFNVNWAIDTPYEKLYHETIFHIANETEVDNFNNTSMFYSEKTFRAIKSMMPFIIYGQPGTNKYLQKLGFKLYDDWFDYSFDDISDPIERYQKILEMLTEVCSALDKMSEEEKIAWKFKNKEVLIHNYRNMFYSDFSKKQFTEFLQNI